MKSKIPFSSLRPTTLSLWSALATLAIPAIALAALHETGTPETGFVAQGPAGLRISGTGHTLTARENGENFVVRVGLSDLRTGIDLRDEHTRNLLDVAHFPNAELVVSKAALRLPAAGDDLEASVQGSLTLHGQTHPVTVQYEAERDGTVTEIDGKARINIEEFGLTAPSYLGITVRSQVEIRAKFKVRDE